MRYGCPWKIIKSIHSPVKLPVSGNYVENGVRVNTCLFSVNSICLTGQNTIRYYLHLNNFIYQAYVTIKMPKYDRKCFAEDKASNRRQLFIVINMLFNKNNNKILW